MNHLAPNMTDLSDLSFRSKLAFIRTVSFTIAILVTRFNSRPNWFRYAKNGKFALFFGLIYRRINQLLGYFHRLWANGKNITKLAPTFTFTCTQLNSHAIKMPFPNIIYKFFSHFFLYSCFPFNLFPLHLSVSNSTIQICFFPKIIIKPSILLTG